MKKIAVVCANGKVGKLVVKEAIARGYDVTGFVRKEDEKNFEGKKVVKDLFELTQNDLKGYDIVVDAFGVWQEELLDLHTKSLMHLCDVLSGTKIRLLVVGGAGSLYVNPEHTMQVKDLPDFPEMYKPLATAQSVALDELRKRDDVNWTFLSPAGNFMADGVRTGKYIKGGEEFFVNAAGKSEISYADYAIAMVDEIESGNNIKKRISVIGE